MKHSEISYELELRSLTSVLVFIFEVSQSLMKMANDAMLINSLFHANTSK